MYNTRRRSLFDSLDYLIPPVQKLPQTVHKDYFLYNDAKLTDQSRLLRDHHRTVFANSFYSKTSESDVQACSSLILKKTTKQLIHEQYSILNLSTCNRGPGLYIQDKTKQREDKPIIKVTVIPTAKQTQTCTVFNKCCGHSTKVQCTVSNQDNSIKNQNVYLFAKGSKREKIHELKVSESAKLSNRNICHKYGAISMKLLTESRQIVNSLNMDKKKRKNNKNKQAVRTNITDDSDPLKGRYGDRFPSPNDRKSDRVTVIGQIGLTPDDRYVLKCAAALNDKPIETNFVNDDENLTRLKNYNYHHGSIQYRPECNENNCKTSRQFRQHDFDVQTDIDNSYYYNVTPATTQNNRGTSQSTQVNFNFPNMQSIKKFRNQTAQCNCYRATAASPLDIEERDNVLKECKSPLVIISVYPRQEKGTDANDTVKIIQRQNSPERKELTHTTRSSKTQENLKKISPGKLYTTSKMESKLSRSRSPSPKTKIGPKNKIENKTDSGGRNNNSVKKGGLSQTRSHKPYIINRLEGNASCHCNHSQFLLTEDFNRPQVKSRDTEEVKKALVNSFLRNVNVMDKDSTKSKLFQPKDNASKVTINIGENDRYDILLEHSNYDTGVAVKKSTKARPYQVISSEEEVNTRSLENFLLTPNEKRRKGIQESKQKTQRIKPPDVNKIKPTGSRLNIKDSIEIFRRQGEHSNYLHTNAKNYNSDFYAPVKHFRGDDCSISDPNERDREIRELLGIMRCHRLQNTEHKEGRSPTDLSCCCPRERSTGISISKLLTKTCLKHKCCKRHEATQIHPPGGNKTTVENPDPKKEDEQKSNKLKNNKITKKSIKKHVSEQLTLKTSEEEETSETREDSSEEFIQKKSNNATLVKSISKKSEKENNLSNTKKHANGMQMQDGIMPQRLTLHRNIQIFLQVEQFNKERPLVLNREQYNKVKKIIECTISKKLSIEKRKRCSLKNCNVVSIGEIKVKPKLQPPLRLSREIQTDRSEIKKRADGITVKYKVKSSRAHDSNHIIINKQMDKQTGKDVILSERYNVEQAHPRQAVSSMEIRYASVECKKRFIISSSSAHLKNDNIHSLHTSNAERNGSSILTIFKGHKRAATPNLGTSAYSLYSNLTDISKKSCKQPQCAGDFKPKKPFLKRLISCLIMRSTQTSQIKNAVQKRKAPSFNNSLDSYHISTSLGALEMTSSLYDTSASFYSNHTTMPVNKIKKGFLSSVRVFLTNRRS